MPCIVLFDKLVTAPLSFVLKQLATVVDNELDDETKLKERLLANQMDLELGEISEEDAAAIEAEILARLRAIREERGEGRGLTAGARVVGAEITFEAGPNDPETDSEPSSP